MKAPGAPFRRHEALVSTDAVPLGFSTSPPAPLRAEPGGRTGRHAATPPRRRAASPPLQERQIATNHWREETAPRPPLQTHIRISRTHTRERTRPVFVFMAAPRRAEGILDFLFGYQCFAFD
ncbi:hypothetical protein EYF80_058177 [Liparis tanakae]|uniref:Uncharacterized protein n=1 Tax=Liparis tanakae TaxID=230148 RepID=A0A4Z2ERW8_9TELE|nr:hypothetical protein EYF80_058177 [Liparis tanakae]